MQQKVTAQIGATPISIETGKIARLADGAVVVTCGDTMVLASAVSATTIKEGQDYFPLTVDYREKAAAVGKFPGGYFKREGRPTEKETLTSRMIDRPLRPLFPQGYFYDTQIISILLSADGENDPDILAMNGASAALCVSDIPFAGPIGAVRVGRVNGELVANPTHTQRAESDLDLVYVGTENDVIMIEGSARELPEAEFLKALEFAHGHAREMIRIQKELAAMVSKSKREPQLLQVNQELLDIAYRVAGDRIVAALYTEGKVARAKAVDALREEVKTAILEKYPETDSFCDFAGIRLRPKKGVSRQHSGKTETGRWSRLSRFATDQLRSKRSAARTRFGHFSARRNPGGCPRYAGADRGGADA